MPLGEHLRELRKRLVLALAGIVVGAVGGWFLFDPLYAQMVAPLEGIGTLNFPTVGQGFNLRVVVALFLGVFLTSPWWIGQLWVFVAPGLTRKERLYSLSFILVGAMLFVGGGLLAWWILPRAIQILTGFTPEHAENLLVATEYFSFFMKIVLFFGVAFLLPLIMVGMNFLGVVSARTLLRGWRWAVLIAFTFTAIANPLPDAWSMIVMGTAITSLFFLAVGICFLREAILRRRSREPAVDEAP